MKVSVILSCHNCATALPVQVEALSCQKGNQNFEIILVDNGSRDSTLETAKRLRHSVSNLRVFSATGRKGFAHARNEGTKYASGEFLLFCTGNDMVGNRWVESMTHALEKDPFIAGKLPLEEINRPDLIETIPPKFRDENDNFILSGPGHFIANGANFGIRRELFLKTGGFNENLTALEDIDLSLRLKNSGILPKEVPESVVHYRLRKTGTGLFHQALVFSLNLVRLSRIHKSDDFRSITKSNHGHRFFTIAGLLTFRRKNRNRFLWMLGQSCGSLIGTLRFRWFPGADSILERLKNIFSRPAKPANSPKHQPDTFP